MCGIGLLLSGSAVDPSAAEDCLRILRRRGPDASATKSVVLQDGGVLHLMASVLHLRGDQLFAQPAEDADGNILLWNGEVFGGLQMKQSESDTEKVLQLLSTARGDAEVVEALASIAGPFSFIYWSVRRRTLYYGRDPIGRRSLVIRKPRESRQPFTILSCVTEDSQRPAQSKSDIDVSVLEEGSPGGSMQDAVADRGGRQSCDSRNRGATDEVNSQPGRPRIVDNDQLPAGTAERGIEDSDSWEEVRADGVYSLSLGSGLHGKEEAALGGDREFLSPVLHAWSSSVGHDANRTAAGVEAASAYYERVSMVDDGARTRDRDKMCPVGNSVRSPPAYAGLLSKLRESIRHRVCTIPSLVPVASEACVYSKNLSPISNHEVCHGTTADADVASESDRMRIVSARSRDDPGATGSSPGSARVGVLFSGGLDSVVVAAMLAEEGEQGQGPAVARGEAIDLINVCFDSPSGHCSPDRLASKAAVQELQKLFPFHEWRLICVNASYDDVLDVSGDVCRAMQPLSTTMDFNIAAAFWFASRGVGRLYQPKPATPPHPPQRTQHLEHQQPTSSPFCAETNTASHISLQGTKVAECSAAIERGEGFDAGVVSKAPGGLETMDIELENNVNNKTQQRNEQALAGDIPKTCEASSQLMEDADKVRGTIGEKIVRENFNGELNQRKYYRDKAKKLNKNMDELCPVEGCRRLLKPGCVFGVCSKCCLKAQQVITTAPTSPTFEHDVDIGGHRRRASLSASNGEQQHTMANWADSPNEADRTTTPKSHTEQCMPAGHSIGPIVYPSTNQPANLSIDPQKGPQVDLPSFSTVEQLTGEADPSRTGHTYTDIVGPLAADLKLITKPAQRQHEHKQQQDNYKARAAEQAIRAIEAHLMEQFEMASSTRSTSPALDVNKLSESLRRRLNAREVKIGRDVHAGSRHRQHTVSQTNRLDKLCLVHKSSNCGGNPTFGATPTGSRDDGGMDSPKRGDVGGKDSGMAEDGRWCLSSEMVHSEARVLLVGIGADEFMGGYSRHRNAYNRGGIDALTDELLKDQGRLWTRNLGRDDRCIADHGRETRFPFLDEGVLAYIRSLPLRDVCDMEQPAGFGDKKILRQVAAHLGLESCRALPKRAIQFGSRIAQHCARRTHGSHRRGSGSDPASMLPKR